MRKLRTFYGKVTEFLNDDKIPCLQRLGVYDYIDVPSKPFIYAIELVVIQTYQRYAIPCCHTAPINLYTEFLGIESFNSA